jgi:IS5 family transposase
MQIATLSQSVQDTWGQTLDKAKRLVMQAACREAVGNRAKLYSWHVLEMECISKCKGRNPHEFGAKVGLPMSLTGNLIVGAISFTGNPYDRHMIREKI